MKKILTTASVALFAIVLGQNVTHATSQDSMTWTFDNATQRPKSNDIEFRESAHFNHSNEWVYADVINTGTTNAPLHDFGADVKNGSDDGFVYTADTNKKLIIGVQDYNTCWNSSSIAGDAYAAFSGHTYLAPGETAHIKLKVGDNSGLTSLSATKVRGVYYAFGEGRYNTAGYDNYPEKGPDGIFWMPIDFKLEVHFWTQNEGWEGTFNVRQ